MLLCYFKKIWIDWLIELLSFQYKNLIIFVKTDLLLFLYRPRPFLVHFTKKQGLLFVVAKGEEKAIN